MKGLEIPLKIDISHLKEIIFIDSLKNIDEIIISPRDDKKKSPSKPFIREFFTITKKK
jgi:hypothetical protein